MTGGKKTAPGRSTGHHVTLKEKINLEVKIQEIYCDESGSTGNNLLHQAQPFFSYASVAISNDEAKEIVSKIIRDYGVQGGELKGKNLIKYSKGRRAITYILENYHDKIQVSVFHKKYNLACKFFEYIFEPTISENNLAFYSIGFNRFIANLLHLHFEQKAKYAEEIFEDFEKLMRTLDDTALTHIFSALSFPNISPVLELIKTFCVHHRATILEELDGLKGTGAGKWILDLTDTALFTQLGSWGEKHEQLEVFCDRAKPLEANKDMFNVMINRKDKIYNEFINKEQPITFNLASEIKLVDSVDYPGIQLADVAAGAAAFMFQNPREDHSQEWLRFATKIVHPLSILPELDTVDLTTFEAQRNFLLLQELVTRSENGTPLLEDIGEFVKTISIGLRHYPLF